MKKILMVLLILALSTSFVYAGGNSTTETYTGKYFETTWRYSENVESSGGVPEDQILNTMDFHELLPYLDGFTYSSTSFRPGKDDKGNKKDKSIYLHMTATGYTTDGALYFELGDDFDPMDEETWKVEEDDVLYMYKVTVKCAPGETEFELEELEEYELAHWEIFHLVLDIYILEYDDEDEEWVFNYYDEVIPHDLFTEAPNGFGSLPIDD